MPNPTPGQSDEDISVKYDICVCLPLKGHHWLVWVMCSEHSGNCSCCHCQHQATEVGNWLWQLSGRQVMIMSCLHTSCILTEKRCTSVRELPLFTFISSHKNEEKPRKTQNWKCKEHCVTLEEKQRKFHTLFSQILRLKLYHAHPSP